MTAKKAVVIYNPIVLSMFVLYVGSAEQVTAYKAALLALENESAETLASIFGGAANMQVVEAALLTPVNAGEYVERVGELFRPAD